ncbi:MAG: hypothetical protein VW362_02795 [Candidatus Nanopelagicales bacterium]
MKKLERSLAAAIARADKKYLRGHNDDGTPWYGTADDLIEDLRQAAEAEAKYADELLARAEQAERENADLRAHIERRANGTDPLTEDLRARAEQAERERDQYRVMWERDSKALGDAIDQRNTARAIAEDNRARYVTAERERDATMLRLANQDDEVIALQRELAEARRDQARYRWLKAQGHKGGGDFYFRAIGQVSQDNLDAAIDAAMAKEPK